MIDVLISGAGPAGSIAAIVLARAGVRVVLLDRARFPRAKLCGDSLNPGALALLRRLGLAAFPERRGLPATGMLVTGEGGARVETTYPAGVRGRFVTRADLDAWLVDQAVAAGAEFEQEVSVTAPMFRLLEGQQAVAGVRAERRGRGTRLIPARLTIAAEGRHSALAFGLGLSRHPQRPRRWALGAYFENACGLSSLGEMHIRAGHYIGIAPLPGGIANACLVSENRAAFRSPSGLSTALGQAICRDPILGPRFASARLITRPCVLGPLAVEARAAGAPGLLLAGDAAGFIDPMTGDGLYFAMRGGELAAEAALLALSGRTVAPCRWLAAQRRREFARRARLNRALRFVVSQPRAVTLASCLATLCPAPVRQIVRIASDM